MEKFKLDLEVDRLKDEWGIEVSKYINSKETDVGRRVKWKNLMHLQLEQNKLEAISEELNNQVVCVSKEEDNILWCGAKSGEYTAKLGYQI